MNITDKSELQKRIGYRFKDESLLIRALVHSSYSNEHKEYECNERLEFLGDSVLSMITAEYLYSALPECREGLLTRVRAALVNEKALAEYAAQIRLGEELFLNSGEEATGGRNRPSVTSDAFEALLAAIYLDGGVEAAKEFVLPFITEGLRKREIRREDAKSALQELVQRKKGSRIEYVLAGERGPDHAKRFEIELYVNGKLAGRGEAPSKKEAEQNAAAEALKNYNNEN